MQKLITQPPFNNFWLSECEQRSAVQWRRLMNYQCAASLGFLTGTPWVTFCHTIPIPVCTIPIMGTGTTQPIITVGSHETHSVGGTHGFFIRGSKMVYQNYKIPVFNKLLNVLNL